MASSLLQLQDGAGEEQAVRPSCLPPKQSARAAGSERRPCGPGTFPPVWWGRRVRCTALSSVARTVTLQ